MFNKVHLRFEFQLRHSILSTTLTTADEKCMHLNFFHISYQNIQGGFRLGTVAGPVIQAIGRPDFEDVTRAGGLLWGFSL